MSLVGTWVYAIRVLRGSHLFQAFTTAINRPNNFVEIRRFIFTVAFQNPHLGLWIIVTLVVSSRIRLSCRKWSAVFHSYSLWLCRLIDDGRQKRLVINANRRRDVKRKNLISLPYTRYSGIDIWSIYILWYFFPILRQVSILMSSFFTGSIFLKKTRFFWT